MATQCSKCGAELPDGAQACTACGAPAAAWAAVAAPAQPPAAPAKSGSSAVKIVLIIVAVFVGLGVLGAATFGFFVWRIAHAVHVSEGSKTVTINAPGGGTISENPSDTYTAADLGIDIYPGATPAKGGMRMTIGGATTIHGMFVTSDSKDQVFAFYKGKVGTDSFVVDSGNNAVLTMNKGNKESVMITITANSAANGGKTQISIIHSTSSSS